MTLCVAAECKRHKRFFNAVVFATDFNVEGEMAKAEIGHKRAILGREEFPALMAGTQTRALELGSQIAEELHETATPLGQDYQSPAWPHI